ncbi:hypothetical protein Tco_1063528 [Tanacetum coccineum]
MKMEILLEPTSNKLLVGSSKDGDGDTSFQWSQFTTPCSHLITAVLRFVVFGVAFWSLRFALAFWSLRFVVIEGCFTYLKTHFALHEDTHSLLASIPHCVLLQDLHCILLEDLTAFCLKTSLRFASRPHCVLLQVITAFCFNITAFCSRPPLHFA